MKLSIIIPVKNQSEKLLKHLQESILPYFDSIKKLTYDILIVSDGGSLEQRKILEEGLASFPMQVKLLEQEDKKGKGHAVRKGILASESDYVLFMDADLATSLDCFDKMLPDLGKVDCLIASRDHKESKYEQKQPFIRKLTHWGAAKVVRMRFHMKEVKDSQCGFKCIRTKLAKLVAKRQIVTGFAFDVEYLYCLHLNGCSIKEYPCVWTDDPDSSVGSPWKTTKAFYKDLGRIKKNKESYRFTEEETC